MLSSTIPTSDGLTVPITPHSSDVPWAQLAAQLDGRLILPSEDPQTHTPTVWNTLLKSPTPVFRPGMPAAVVMCGSKTDVQRAVTFGVRHGLNMSAKGKRVYVAMRASMWLFTLSWPVPV
jgi:hypothetical protein